MRLFLILRLDGALNTNQEDHIYKLKEYSIQTQDILIETKLFLDEFKKMSTSPVNQKSLTLLVNELGNCPLAIEQAGNNIKKNKIKISDYLDKLRKSDDTKKKELNTGKGFHHKEPYTKSIKLNYDELCTDKNTKNLLQIISFLDIRIDKDCLSKIYTDFEFKDLDSAISLASDSSFIKYIDGNTLKTHSLIQFIIRTEIINRFEWIQRIKNFFYRLLGKSTEYDKQTLVNQLWNTILKILPENINFETIDQWKKLSSSIMLINGTEEYNEFDFIVYTNYVTSYHL